MTLGMDATGAGRRSRVLWIDAAAAVVLRAVGVGVMDDQDGVVDVVGCIVSWVRRGMRC